MEQIKNMMEAGMDVARINMDYFTPFDIEQLMSNVQSARQQLSHPCPVFIDLKGMLIRTLTIDKINV